MSTGQTRSSQPAWGEATNPTRSSLRHAPEQSLLRTPRFHTGRAAMAPRLQRLEWGPWRASTRPRSGSRTTALSRSAATAVGSVGNGNTAGDGSIHASPSSSRDIRAQDLRTRVRRISDWRSTARAAWWALRAESYFRTWKPCHMRSRVSSTRLRCSASIHPGAVAHDTRWSASRSWLGRASTKC